MIQSIDRYQERIAFGMPPRFWLKWLDHDNRLRIDMATDSQGDIWRFTIQYETGIEGRWYPVVRCDTAHNEAHIDYLDPAGVEYLKRMLRLTEPYNSTLTLIEESFAQTWSTHRQRFMQQWRETHSND